MSGQGLGEGGVLGLRKKAREGNAREKQYPTRRPHLVSF
jgi:hypothetical protein